MHGCMDNKETLGSVNTMNIRDIKKSTKNKNIVALRSSSRIMVEDIVNLVNWKTITIHFYLYKNLE